MKIKLDNEVHEVVVTKKVGNRNTYIRVKDDLKIYVSTGKFTSDKEIERIIIKNKKSVLNMLEKAYKQKQYNDSFYFLGKKYEIVYVNDKDLYLGSNKVFIPKGYDVDKWYKKQANKLFEERLTYNFDKFSRRIPKVHLTIRKMKTRWGVCNTKDKRITLNLELIKRDISCLDYVINHELSHLIYADHSKNFWSVVEENFPDYKRVRKSMRTYE